VLDGKLSVELLDGFQPGAGDAFDVLDWDALSGTFSQVSLPELSPGLGWDTSRLYSSGTLSVVPEPGTLALLLAAAFLLAAWRKIR
jgi:hypothetical protein